MHAPTKGTTPRTRLIPAVKIENLIVFLEDHLHESQDELLTSRDQAKAFAQGRMTAFVLALDCLREIAKCPV